MLQRSEGSDAGVDCDDPVVALACSLDTDECPAACKSDSKDDDEVVKSGSLVVSSSAADDRKVVVASGSTAVSDLDTLTFKTSEEVEITRVVLEKYGYSSASDLITNIWLEDENGKEVSNKAKPNTKGLVNLTIKKDYKVVDGTFNATIVVETKANAAVGGTVGFKVTDVTSTAKDVDLGNYKAYTYDVVRYDGTKATVTAKGGSKDYNYEAGKAVEVSKFKIKAPDDSAITVNGFTLTDSGTMDIYDNFDADSIEVTVDGDVVKANADITKKEELTISFRNPVEVAAKQKVEVIVTTKLNSDFEDYGKTVQLILKNESDLSASDKNNARVTVDKNTNFVQYIINGGKVKISSTKLGNIEAAINSTDVKLAEGEITVSEAIEGTLTIKAEGEGVKALDTMRLEIAGDEYDGTPSNNKSTWTFDNIEVSKSGRIRLYVDLLEDTTSEGKSITFSIDGWKDLNYVDGQNTDKIDVSGSLNISKLTLTQARGTLVNNLSSSEDIEFPNKELNTFTIFDGTYTAKKQNINLNSFTIKGSNTGNSVIRFYLYVDDMKDSVADVKLGTGSNLSGSDSFNDILVKAGESVKVKVEAEVDAKEVDNGSFKRAEIGKFTLVLEGEDENDNPNGGAEKSTSKIVIVKKGSVSVSEASTAAKLVLRKSSDAKVAEVTVKPDGTNTVTLESIDFDITFDNAYDGEVKLYVDGSNEDLSPVKTSYAANSTTSLSADLNKTVESEGVAVRIELEDEYEGTVTVSNLKVNDKDVKKDFVKRFEQATIWFSAQSSTKIDTKFTFGVNKKSSDSIDNVYIYTGAVTKGTTPTVNSDWISVKNGNEVKEGDTFSVLGDGNNSYYITAIAYTINGGNGKSAVAATSGVITYTLSGDYTWTLAGNTLTYSGSTEKADIILDITNYTWSSINGDKITATEKTASDLSTCTPLAKTTCAVTTVGKAGSPSQAPTDYIVVTKADFDDYFKVNLKENGDYISIAKAD